MTSLRQIIANRRNSEKSTGPKTENGKRQSRRNALRHGLRAETVIEILEDTENYKALEITITSDYDPQTAVERELVLHLASLLGRIRRATSIETDLMRVEAETLRDRQTTSEQRKRSGPLNITVSSRLRVPSDEYWDDAAKDDPMGGSFPRPID